MMVSNTAPGHGRAVENNTTGTLQVLALGPFGVAGAISNQQLAVKSHPFGQGLPYFQFL